MRERDIAVGDLGARVKTILFPKGKEYCIADRETEGNYCWSRLAVVSLVSLSLESGYVDLLAAVGGTKDYSYHSGLAEDAIGRKTSLLYSNTFIVSPEEFSYGLISVRGWAKKSGIGVIPELKKERRKESELTTCETRLISSGIISAAVAAVMELSSDELKQASEQGLELSAEEIRGLHSGFKCSIYDT